MNKSEFKSYKRNLQSFVEFCSANENLTRLDVANSPDNIEMFGWY